MDISYTDLTRGISAELGQLRSEIPDTLQAFHALGKAASAAAAETSPIQNTVRHIGESTSLRSMVASSFQSVPAIGR